MELTSRKKIVLKITLILTTFLIICTFASRSIYTFLLPRVETVALEIGSIVNSFNTTGKANYADSQEVFAANDMKITEVLVETNKEVKKGDPLFLVDTADSTIELRRLELNLLQKQNQLKPTVITPEKKSELELKLKIAEMELELFKTNQDIKFEQEGQKQQTILLQYREKSLETQEQLDLAIAELNKYNYEAGADYDYAQAQRLRLAVLQASNQLLLLGDDVSFENKTAAQLQYETALREYEQFTRNFETTTAVSEEKLNLTIMEYQNMLNPQQLTQTQKSELQMQIDIAKNELKSFKNKLPVDGKIIAEQDGKVLTVDVKPGQSVTRGQLLVGFIPSVTMPVITWDTSYEAGLDFSVGSSVTATFKVNIDGLSKNQTLAVNITSKKIDDATGLWKFTADFPESEYEINMGRAIGISMTKKSDMYMQVVPLACIQKDENGKDIIRVIRQRSGLFSEEDYVSELEVKIIETNNLSAAIECDGIYSSMRLIKYTTKPIRAGAVVTQV